MRDTQLAAYNDIQGHLTDRQQSVLRVIRLQREGMSLLQIASALDWPINSVSGRVTELNRAGMVVDNGIRVVNPSGKKAIVWQAV